MRTVILTVSLMMSLSNLALAETQLDKQNSVDIIKKQSNWELIQPGISCIENYQFSTTNNEVLIKSNQERIVGSYSFVEKEQGFELPAIVINFITDNQKSDCKGSSVNQAGISSTHFLKMVSDQKIFFCLDAFGKNCPVYIRPKY